MGTKMKRFRPYNEMVWRHLYSSGGVKYGNLKRGSRVVANGVSERDGKIICEAVNKEKH